MTRQRRADLRQHELLQRRLDTTAAARRRPSTWARLRPKPANSTSASRRDILRLQLFDWHAAAETSDHFASGSATRRRVPAVSAADADASQRRGLASDGALSLALAVGLVGLILVLVLHLQLLALALSLSDSRRREALEEPSPARQPPARALAEPVPLERSRAAATAGLPRLSRAARRGRAQLC